MAVVAELICAMSTSSDSNGVLSLLQGRAPQYRDAHDAVVFAIHTHLLRKGLVCHALTPPASPSPADLQRELPVVPPGWNGSDEAYSFTYHQQRAATVAVVVVLKAIKMGQTLLVHMITQRLLVVQQPSAAASSASAPPASASSAAVKDEVPVSLEVNVTDYINTGASLSDYRALYRDLAGLLLLFDSQLGSRVIPTAAAADSRATAVPDLHARDPLRFPQRNPLLVDDDDDDDRLRDPRARPQRGDFDGDLNPLAVGGGISGNLMGPRNFPSARSRP